MKQRNTAASPSNSNVNRAHPDWTLSRNRTKPTNITTAAKSHPHLNWPSRQCMGWA